VQCAVCECEAQFQCHFLRAFCANKLRRVVGRCFFCFFCLFFFFHFFFFFCAGAPVPDCLRGDLRASAHRPLTIFGQTGDFPPADFFWPAGKLRRRRRRRVALGLHLSGQPAGLIVAKVCVLSSTWPSVWTKLKTWLERPETSFDGWKLEEVLRKKWAKNWWKSKSKSKSKFKFTNWTPNWSSSLLAVSELQSAAPNTHSKAHFFGRLQVALRESSQATVSLVQLTANGPKWSQLGAQLSFSNKLCQFIMANARSSVINTARRR